MFPLSRRADYAVRIMLELGDQTGKQRVPANQVAQQTGVPLPFLRKIVADLAKGGLVRAFSGPTGGLELGRPAESINLLHILEAMEGPVCLNVCILRPEECLHNPGCPVHNFLGRLQASIIQQLQEATLDKLVAEKREFEHHSVRSNIVLHEPDVVIAGNWQSGLAASGLMR